MTQSDFIARFGAADPREVYAYGIDQYFRLMEQRDALQPLLTEIARIGKELEGDLYHEVYKSLCLERDRIQHEYDTRRKRITSDLRHYTTLNRKIDLLINAPTVGGRGIQQDGADRQEVAA